MSRGLADTSIFIARESQRPLDDASLPDELAVSTITIGELRAGVLVAADVVTRDRRLETLTTALGMQPLPVNDEVAAHWARLRVMLRDAGLRMPINDSWIAATALSIGVPVITQDGDYPHVADLAVISV